MKRTLTIGATIVADACAPAHRLPNDLFVFVSRCREKAVRAP
jgi:hypothetical protein